MSAWEAGERARLSGRQVAGEWVGVRVTFPTSKLLLQLKVPESLSTGTAYVEFPPELGLPEV